MDDIPVIDINPYLLGSESGLRSIAKQVNKACEEFGFFLIEGHGVPEDSIHRTYAAAEAFFRLPLEDKLGICMPSPGVARGYTPYRGETLSAGLGRMAPPDLKEVIDIGPIDVPGGEYYERAEASGFFCQNRWPAAPAEFIPTMECYYRRMNRLANDLMAIFATALDLPEAFFFDKLDKNTSALRLLCYPEQTEPPEAGQLRGGVHTDYGTIAIVMSDAAAGGLQAQRRDGHWVDVTPRLGTFAVIIGDIMQVWTNDRWVSTMHRVANPPPELASSSRRHSVVFYNQPNYDAVIDVLPSCYGPGRAKAYEPTTFKDHWRGKWQATRSSAP